MDDRNLRELKDLRARAYGATPDILGDPLALRRLVQLESDLRGPDHGVPPDEDASEPVTPSSDAASVPGRSPVSLRVGPRVLAAVWAASILLTAAGTALVSSAIARPQPLTPESHHVGTLGTSTDSVAVALFSNVEPDPGLVRTESDVRGFADFLGLSLVAVRGAGPTGAASECLYVLPSADVDPHGRSMLGAMVTGCAAGTFPATTQLPIGADAPPALRDRFGVGTALQFALRGDQVFVFASDAG